MLIAQFRQRVFANEQNSFCVHKVRIIETDLEQFREGQTITLRGYGLPESRICFDYEGKVVRDKNYGLQFEVLTYREVIGDDKKSVIDYLSCGEIKGVGKKLAKKIYETFDKDTMEVIRKTPERLSEVRGIGEVKALQIAKCIRQTYLLRNVMALLIPEGITVGKCCRICDEFKDDAVRVIKEEPYRLCEIATFKLIDVMARKNGVPAEDPARLHAAISFALFENEKSGNCGMDTILLLSNVKELLGEPAVSTESINAIATAMYRDGEIVMAKAKQETYLKGKTIVYRKKVYDIETRVAREFYKKSTYISFFKYNADEEITNAEKRMGIILHENQREAVKNALENYVSIITGEPGTGKTQLLLVLTDIYRELFPEKKIALLSPTGKAARRMTEKCHIGASTVHKALGMSPDDPEDLEYYLDADIVIIDEASMIDIFLAEKILNSLKDDAQVILMGDVYQLPSVRAGAVLHDLIEANVCPVTFLTHVFRQDTNSNILHNAHNINNGNAHLKLGDDFSFFQAETPEKTADIIEEVYVSEVAKFGQNETILLCPMKKGKAGVYEMNKRLQARLNPEGPCMNFRGSVFRVGDPVIQMENKEEVSNGDVGTIISHTIDEEGEYITVHFEAGIDLDYHREEMEQLQLAYALTVHKSQGSEYSCVITAYDRSNRKLLKRNLIYTAVTRGVNKVDLIGSPDAILTAIKTNDSTQRVSLLIDKILEYRELDLESCPFMSA